MNELKQKHIINDIRRAVWYFRNQIFRKSIEQTNNIRRSVILWNNKKSKQRIGIFVKGSCDLNSIFLATPALQKLLKGYACIFMEGGGIVTGRSDFILQCLEENGSNSVIQEISNNLNVPRERFTTQILEKNVHENVNKHTHIFPKKVIILSMLGNIMRDMYRHKKTGFLVDPGVWWLNNPMNDVLSKMETAGWIRNNFEKTGKMDVPTFQSTFSTLVMRIKNETDAHLIVYNALTVDPGDRAHNYQFMNSAPTIRYREFNVALMELSKKLNFSIVDVDRILKKYGVKNQKEIMHWQPECAQIVGSESIRVMREIGIFQ